MTLEHEIGHVWLCNTIWERDRGDILKETVKDIERRKLEGERKASLYRREKGKTYSKTEMRRGSRHKWEKKREGERSIRESEMRY